VWWCLDSRLRGNDNSIFMKTYQNETEFLNQSVGDGGFLQSEIWRKFQEKYGRKTNHFEDEHWWVNSVEHTLPVVGAYGYVPRGPILKAENEKGKTDSVGIQNFFDEMKLERNWGWVRIEPDTEKFLKNIQSQISYRIVPAPHTVQPREILMLDISGTEEEILKQMKPKTRYNIHLAERKEVKVYHTQNKRAQEAFIRLVTVTAKRDGITPHPKNYYEMMFEIFPPENWELFVAEYKGDIIAVNLVVFFGKYATYLHGASADEHREVMAPYLLQWRSITYARSRFCEIYDLGGVDTVDGQMGWAGITRFKTGFAQDMETRKFPGAYDTILFPWKYRMYRILQKIKR